MGSDISSTIPPEIMADTQAVLDHLSAGTPLDPAVAQRVRERSQKGTEELHQKHGDLKVAVDLIREISGRRRLNVNPIPATIQG